MPKTKKPEDNLSIAPPVPECISAKYLIKLPVNDGHFKDSSTINSYATHLLENKLGDDVEISRLKIRKPGLTSRTLAKILKKTPNAKLYVTVNF